MPHSFIHSFRILSYASPPHILPPLFFSIPAVHHRMRGNPLKSRQGGGGLVRRPTARSYPPFDSPPDVTLLHTLLNLALQLQRLASLQRVECYNSFESRFYTDCFQ